MPSSDKRNPEGPRDDEKSTRVIGGSRSAPRPAPSPIEGDAPTELQRWAADQGAAPRVSLDAGAPTPNTGATGRYVAETVLGRGGVGEVDLVLDRDLGRKVAKKRLRSELRSDPVLLQAFLEEAMITGALEHPGIVPVHDIGVSPGEGPWYTMKRLTGEALSTILSKLRSGHAETVKSWPLARLVEVFVQVLRAIAHAHQRGVIHCDLKPGNVLVGELGEVVVVDWGLAKVLGEGGRQQARARLWSGSPGYMSPEQATSEDIDKLTPASDIWALGAMLYELMALVLPQAGPDGAIPEPGTDAEFAPVVPLRRRATLGPYRREAPPELAAIAERALSFDPAARHPSVAAMLAEVEGWLAGTRERERREARVLAAAKTADRVLVGQVQRLDELSEATDALVDALRDAPDRPELMWRGSALYWHVFRLLHLQALPRDPAAALLDRLAAMVVPAPESGSGVAPWLEALDEVADEAPQVRALAAQVRALHATPIFAELDGHGLVPVASAVEARVLEAGAALFREGEPGDALWILLSGEVEVVAGGKVLNVMHPPAAFGEVALVDRSTRTASVIAKTRVGALTLTAERFDDLVRRHGAIALGVMKLLAARLRTATAREVAG